MGKDSGLPISLWNRDILSKVGEACGGFLGMDAKTERMEELQWARIRTRPTLSVSPTEEREICYAVGGWDAKTDLRVGAPHGVLSWALWLQLKPQEQKACRVDRLAGLSDEALWTEGFNQSSSSVASLGPKENRRIEAWRPTVEAGLVAEKEPSDHLAEAQRCGPSHAGSPLSYMSLFGRRMGCDAGGEYCDLSGLGEKRDEDENPLQMLMGMEPPVSGACRMLGLVEASKDRIDVIGKGWTPIK
ncbi:hypothetical protein CK203_090921 [Vitis vinifera]|uniref:Uncharacterized protein n=1 Tax=Vitis vinifera TaxID=29760 RepID=A0A438DRX4_VITVI|nr:hypothetical protein CK203_090921 [Vitis vinifera]